MSFPGSTELLGTRLGGQQATIEFVKASFAHAPHDHLFALYLGENLELLAVDSVGAGSIEDGEGCLSNILRKGARVGAAGFILVHNQPKGDPIPGQQEMALTRRIRSLSEDLDMPLLDHLIVGPQSIISLVDR